MNNYCLGFLFDSTGGLVLLMQKLRPDWQRHKFNGVGGHIEEKESAAEAMVREFSEEVSCDADPPSWDEFACLSGENFCIHCFMAFNDCILTCEANSDEDVYVKDATSLPESVIPNLRWLIPMALSMQRGETCRHFTISEA